MIEGSRSSPFDLARCVLAWLDPELSYSEDTDPDGDEVQNLREVAAFRFAELINLVQKYLTTPAPTSQNGRGSRIRAH